MRDVLIKHQVYMAVRENFLRNVIFPEEWRDRTGMSLLKELRELGYPINTKDFYYIRRKLMKEYGYNIHTREAIKNDPN